MKPFVTEFCAIYSSSIYSPADVGDPARSGVSADTVGGLNGVVSIRGWGAVGYE